VVGGGPAGMLAAVYLARFCRRVALFDHGKSRARWIPRTRNVPAYPDGLAGEALLGRLAEQLARYQVRRSDAAARSLQGERGGFTLNGELEARRVLIATGVEDSMPEDLEYLWPLVKRGQVRLCPVCDAFELCGKRIGVLARGEHGLREARFLLSFTSELWVLSHGEGHCDAAVKQALGNDRVNILEGAVRQVIPTAEGGLGVLLADGELLKLDALYVGFGVRVRSELAVALGARADRAGYLQVDRKQETTVPGLYAAGDVVQSLSQISVAFGQAAIAASAINVSLNEDRWPS
jgi:thioredoxin reductase (NADPH)